MTADDQTPRSDEAEWRRIGMALGIPYSWRLWPHPYRGAWKLTAAGADPLECGHKSMEVTADSLPLAVAFMARRLEFHKRYCQ